MTKGIPRKYALTSVGPGWSRLINNLYDAKPKDVMVTQVKEKYGTLRFYVASAPEWYFDLIDCYEDMSGRICETCGAPGRTREYNGWLLTSCSECNDKMTMAKNG